MKTTASTKGQIILSAEIRQRDGIESDQELESNVSTAANTGETKGAAAY